jgi:hypothetical protein
MPNVTMQVTLIKHMITSPHDQLLAVIMPVAFNIPTRLYRTILRHTFHHTVQHRKICVTDNTNKGFHLRLSFSR